MHRLCMTAQLISNVGKFLCSEGVSYALFISLLIFKLFWTKGCMGGGGENPPSPSLPYWDKVNSLCPVGGGGGECLAGQSNSLRPCGGGRGKGMAIGRGGP
jgi:hypothetical protein